MTECKTNYDKNFLLTIIFFIVLNSILIAIEPLSQIGPVDEETMKLIQGQWITKLGGAQVIHEYTNEFACKIDGLKYYHYNRVGARSSYPFVYTIVKSKKTGRYYFARGYYKDERLYGNTSRIKFTNNDCFLVYSDQDPESVYFKATRFMKKEFEKIR